MFEAFMIRLLAFVVTIAILVVFHELGHYWMARLCGVKVLRFSFGFGKVLWSRRYGPDQTEWAFSALPFGGYVKMLGEGDEGEVDEKDLPRAFNRQSVGKRFAIVAAGPFTNLFLAIVLFAVVGMVGTREMQPVMASPLADTPAAVAGLQKLDRITAVDGVAVGSLADLHMELLKNARRDVTLGIERNNAALTVNLSLATVTTADEENGRIMQRVGLRLYTGAPLVRGVLADSPAAAAGLKSGDHITAVEGVRLETASGLSEAIEAAGGQPVRITVKRDGAEQEMMLTPQMMADPNGSEAPQPKIGVQLSIDPQTMQQYVTTVRYDPLTAMGRGLMQTWDLSWLSLKMMGRMVIGDVSLKNLSGPITIADFAGESAQLGLMRFVTFLALISVALGVINLLPIPLLDGGHLLYYSVEILRGRPLSERTMAIGQRIGIVFIFFLIALALFNDFSRLL